MFSRLTIIFFLFSFESLLAIDVGGRLRDDTVWKKNRNPYYVTGDVGVPDGVTLTIEAGVKIIYDTDCELVINGGSLEVHGTPEAPVSFSSTVKGSKPMLVFKSADLAESWIISAQFTGPKRAIQFEYNDKSEMQNEGVLTIESSSFTNGSEINSIDHYADSKSSFLFHNVTILNSKLTTNYGKNKQPIYMLNSSIINSTIRVVGYESVTLISSCYLENTSIELMFDGQSSTIYIDNSTLINVQMKVNVEVYSETSLLLLQHSIYRNGSITGALDGINLVIDYSSLTYVNIKSSENSDDISYSPYFTLNHSTFHQGCISMETHQTNIISSDIIVLQSPIRTGDNSKIDCSSITRTDKTNKNRIGISASSIEIKDSSVYNFQIGIRVSKPSNISSSNLYDNSVYNVDNQGPHDIQATDNWWGTSNKNHISDSIYDYYTSGRTAGKVDYSRYSTEPKDNQCPKDLPSEPVYSSTKRTTTAIMHHSNEHIPNFYHYGSASSKNYPHFLIFSYIFIFLLKKFI